MMLINVLLFVGSVGHAADGDLGGLKLGARMDSYPWQRRVFSLSDFGTSYIEREGYKGFCPGFEHVPWVVTAEECDGKVGSIRMTMTLEKTPCEGLNHVRVAGDQWFKLLVELARGGYRGANGGSEQSTSLRNERTGIKITLSPNPRDSCSSEKPCKIRAETEKWKGCK